MTQTESRIAFVTTGSEDEALKIGRTLVEEGLAACANLLPQIRSIYRWQDKIEDEPEVLMILKTTQSRLPALIDRVQELHSYDVPEIVAVPIVAGLKPYLDWVRENTQDRSAQT